MNAIGQPIPHESAREHVRGSAAYIDDFPPIRDELFVGFVGSRVSHGRITAIDVAAARSVPGVAAVFTAADVPENRIGPVVHDEELLASEEVLFAGQPIVAIAAETRTALAAARSRVEVRVEPLPAVLTIEDAIGRESFIGPARTIRRGDAAAALAAAPHRLRGELRIGGQEHFYLETQAALAIPHDGGELVVHSSTQNPTEIQAIVARVLRRTMAQVTCICRRMGGGFGGKETQAALPAALAALAAARTGRPARCVLAHEDDFRVTGKRHPYLVRYDVGFRVDGVIDAYRAEFFSNGGFSADLSLPVMERTLFHAENAYFIPHVEFIGRVCRTNLPSNTAFRGFGGPQAVAAIESVIEDIAAYLRIDGAVVRKRNCYSDGDRAITPYGQVVRDHALPEILDELLASSDYERRRMETSAFNSQSRTHLRGLAVTPVKFGISFTRKTMNQANALVHVQLDGSVQVSTGGTEMGQGLSTKLQQIVADEFGLPVEAIRVLPASTERNHNTSPTAASASTDLNGAAAVEACRQIRKRLETVIAARGERVREWLSSDTAAGPRIVSFREAIAAAHEARVDLGARGFFATPGIDFDRDAGRGSPFRYFTTGAAVAEVEIDRWLGDVIVRRVDLVLDLGRPINPAIDRGQTIGGFVQGLGWVTTEALVVDAEGRLLSDSATTYKIPNVTDIPSEFHVRLRLGQGPPDNFGGNKAVGEPPLLLAVSIWAAIKQALASLVPGTPAPLDLPATNEEVLRRLTDLQREPPSTVPEANGEASAESIHDSVRT